MSSLIFSVVVLISLWTRSHIVTEFLMYLRASVRDLLVVGASCVKRWRTTNISNRLFITLFKFEFRTLTRMPPLWNIVSCTILSNIRFICYQTVSCNLATLQEIYCQNCFEVNELLISLSFFIWGGAVFEVTVRDHFANYDHETN